MLRVTFELAVIVGPLVAQLWKVFVVEFLAEENWLHIIDSALAIKLIILPMAFISYHTILVIEFSKAIHLVIFPLSFIVPSIFKVQSPVAVTLIIAFVTLVFTSLRNFLSHKLKFLFELVVLKLISESWVRKWGFVL